MAKIILILIAVVALVVVVVRLQGDAYAKFKANSVEVKGVIEKKETRIDTPNNRNTENILIYSYAVDGVTYHGEERVEYDDLWLDAREGMELRVYVSKTDPKKSHPAVLIDRRLSIRGTR